MIEALSSQPRVPLAHLPTPLDPLDRLSETLGGPRIWMKRDDCTGLGTGGNKTRKLEFLLGAAQSRGADTIVTYGAVQSNHARQTAAACAALGMDCHLILARKVPWTDPTYERLGNVLLDRLFGATLHLVAPDRVRASRARLLEELEGQGRRPYEIPTGGSNGIGALGYVACAEELCRQCAGTGMRLDTLVHATSSAGTQAGLLAGFALLDRLSGADAVHVHGINVSEPIDAVPALIDTIGRIADDALSLIGHAAPLDTSRIQVDTRYVGDGYGLPTDATLAAIRLVAGCEGILLDPVYSGKAMSGLIGRIRAGEFDRAGDVVFLHTGGVAALPVYGEVLTA